MHNGTRLVASGVGRLSGICVAGSLLGRALAAATFARVAYEFVVCVAMRCVWWCVEA